MRAQMDLGRTITRSRRAAPMGLYRQACERRGYFRHIYLQRRSRPIDVSRVPSNTPTIMRLGTYTRTLLILLCIGLVIMRVGGAHLHYCFDGSEPPVTLHVESHGAHHSDPGVSASGHADMDVALGVDALIKKSLFLDLL